AEDGIRDRTVTGVQTCALPIWRDQHSKWKADLPGRGRSARFEVRSAVLVVNSPNRKASWVRIIKELNFVYEEIHLPSCRGRIARSEERRVGKECRSRWWMEA